MSFFPPKSFDDDDDDISTRRTTSTNESIAALGKSMFAFLLGSKTMKTFHAIYLCLTVGLLSSADSLLTVSTIESAPHVLKSKHTSDANLVRFAISAAAGGASCTNDGRFYTHKRSLVMCLVSSGETPDELMVDDMALSDSSKKNNKHQQQVDNGQSSSAIEIPPVIFQLSAAVCAVVVAFFALNAIVDTASHIVSGAGHALGSEIVHEMGNVVGFVGSLVVALFEILKIVVPAVGKALFALGKAATPVLVEKSQQLSEAAAPYAAKATQVVSDAAAPYVNEVTTTVTTNVVQPFQQTLDAKVIAPLQSAQDEARATVEATIQNVQNTVTMQMNDVQNSVTSQVETTLQSAQKQVEQILR